MEKAKKHRKKEVSFFLYIKSWEKEIPTYWRNVLIAEALNYCVYNEGLVIKGYWLTQKRLYLVILTEKHSAEHILNVFAKQVAKGMYEYQYRLKNSQTTSGKSILFTDLFIKLPLYNQYIIQLITGEKILLPYYNPYVVQLQHKIHDDNYCSAIDYRGAIGPVVVKTH